MWGWILFLLLILIILGRNKRRGYIWKDRKGNQLSFKEFTKRWKSGIEEATPLQTTKITLWAFLPMFAGILWGIVITFMAETYWMTLILSGSLPLTLIQFLSNWQKFKRLKIIEKEMEQVQKRIDKEVKKKRRKKIK